MEKRTLSSDNILDGNITDHDAEHKRYEHRISVLETRLDEHHQKSCDDPDYTHISSCGDKHHDLIEKRRI